jgi:hypothetical protein
MADESASNRWWENYLVRYFLPSIVGMLIVAWLQQNTGASRYLPTFYPIDWKNFNTSYLVLWLLIGSLYCYIASYPALVFHATRILDFKDILGRIWMEKRRLVINPYVACTLFAFLSSVCCGISFFALRTSKILSVCLVLAFACLQIRRIWQVSSRFGDFGLRLEVEGKENASIAYAYLRFLAERRGITRKNATNEDEEMTKETEKEVVETYRHLREHGNTALIVLLEFALCPILFIVLGSPSDPRRQIGAHDPQGDILLSLILVFWIFPSVCIHGFAQHLERRFSWFKSSIEDGKDSSQIDEERKNPTAHSSQSPPTA